MGIVIDLIIIGICVLIILSSWRRGLIKSAMGLIKGIVSFIAAYAFTPVLADILYEKFAIGWISSAIENDILKNTASGGSFDLQKLLTEIPEWFGQILDRYGADKIQLAEKFGNISAGSSEDVAKIARIIADPVAGTLSSVAAFIILFTAVFAVLSLATLIIDSIFHLPLLHGVNKTAGLVFGVLEALLVASLLSFLLADLTVSMGAVNSELFGEQVVRNSLVLRFLSEYNITGIIGNVIG